MLHRNIKGGQVDLLMERENLPDPVLDRPMADSGTEEEEEGHQRKQIQQPPQLVGEEDRQTEVEAVDGDRELEKALKLDDRRRGFEDKSLENDGRPHKIENPPESQADREEDAVDAVAAVEEGNGGRVSEGKGGHQQDTESDGPQTEVGVGVLKREEVAGVLETGGNQLSPEAGKKEVVVRRKPKIDGSPATPEVRGHSDRPRAIPKKTSEDNSPPPLSKKEASPSLPPGVVAKSKKKGVVGKNGGVAKKTDGGVAKKTDGGVAKKTDGGDGGKSDGGAPGVGVRSFPKEQVPGGGGGGGGEEEKQINAVEMAKAIESGEMVSLESGSWWKRENDSLSHND